MKSFEIKARNFFGEIIINKSFIHQAGFGARAIPTYVAEWIISYFTGDAEEIDNHTRERMASFMAKYVPAKGEKESVKNNLLEQQEVELMDNYNVSINLAKGDRYLSIPFLDISDANVSAQIIENNEMLLSSGLWGVGSLFYIPPSSDMAKGQIWMREFKPFQIANIDLEYYCNIRLHFSTEEWIDFMVSSMGFNPDLYSERQKILLLARLIPMIEPRYNLVELAPKGTGKSFVYDNMSRYVAVRAGNITPAVLFFNDSRKTAGLITKYDCVVIDEAQKVKGDSSGELTALLKTYLESGKFGKGTASAISAEAGLVILANIELDDKKQPYNAFKGLFRVFPNFLRETAFIDRFSGFLPGWYLPRVTRSTPSQYFGLKGDIFGEIIHKIRYDQNYRNFVKSNLELIDCEDMRDSKAIEAGTTGLLKIIFPDLNPNEQEFYKYCVNPAIEFRQRVRDELCKMDREYDAVSIRSKYPDDFQNNHQRPVYFEESEEEIVDKIKSRDIREDIYQFKTSPELTTGDLEEKQIDIEDDETGRSYKDLFGPYLKEVKNIRLEDPYILVDYQIKNLLSFCELLDSKEGLIKLHLVTNFKDEDQKEQNTEKFTLIQAALHGYNIEFTFEFDPNLHDRIIKMDNGWHVIPGRGLDIFKAPDFYGLYQDDQTKRKCRKCRIYYKKSI